MAVFVYDAARDCMVDKETREPMVTGPWRPVTPMTRGDLPGYASPVTGEWIEGRRARQYDLEKNNCIDTREIRPTPKLKNEVFAKKHGLEHLLG